MHKIGIVEDNQIIRHGLEKNIPWESIGCNVVMTAVNGAEALEIIQKTKPDIVISDVKMPFMDGLEMTGIIREQYPEIKVIIISAYDEFEYVQKGIKLKVFDYIMKPVNYDLLLESVRKAVTEFEAEEKTRQQFEKIKPVIEQKFLIRLIYGYYTLKEINSELSILDLFLDYSTYLSAVIILDEYQSKNLAVEYLRRESIKLSIMDFCKKSIRNDENIYLLVFDPRLDEIVVIFASNILIDNLENKAFDLMNHVRQYTEEKLNTTISIGIGLARHSILDIQFSYQECNHALAFRHIFGQNQTIRFKDIGLSRKNVVYNKTVWNNELFSKVKMGLEQQSISEISDIGLHFIEQLYPLEYACIAAIEFGLRLFTQHKILGEGDDGNSFDMLYSYITEVQKCVTISESFDKVKQLTKTFCSSLHQQKGTHQEQIITLALEYIANNYTNEQFSLYDLAAKVYITPAYLSLLFKQIKGVNFTDILLSTRMEHAKKLLCSSNMKIYEIAEKVGYSDPNYFSVCFKKYTRYTTSEFRNIK